LGNNDTHSGLANLTAAILNANVSVLSKYSHAQHKVSSVPDKSSLVCAIPQLCRPPTNVHDGMARTNADAVVATCRLPQHAPYHQAAGTEPSRKTNCWSPRCRCSASIRVGVQIKVGGSLGVVQAACARWALACWPSSASICLPRASSISCFAASKLGAFTLKPSDSMVAFQPSSPSQNLHSRRKQGVTASFTLWGFIRLLQMHRCAVSYFT